MRRVYRFFRHCLNTTMQKVHHQKKDLTIPLEKWNDLIYINRILKDRSRYGFKIITEIDTVKPITQKPYTQNAGHHAVLIFNALCESDIVQAESKKTKMDIVKFCKKYRIEIKRII